VVNERWLGVALLSRHDGPHTHTQHGRTITRVSHDA
jgi:hypothetical protein